MKALLINGSPHKRGVTNLALETVAEGLAEGGCDAEIVWLGAKPISGCLACGRCRETGRCGWGRGRGLGWWGVFFFSPATPPTPHAAPGFVRGAPPLLGAPPGQVTSAMHRLFYTGAVDWSGKVGAAVVNSRRGGETTAFDQLNKYFTISGMPIVSSYYWNELYGNTPEEAAQDAEGLAVMRQLGRNMAWLIACIKDGAEAGHPYPGRVHRAQTNFIR